MSAVAKKASAVNVPAGEYLSIPVDEITVAGNVRRTFDEERLAELAASVREKGVLEPLLVRPLDGQYGRVYELVCGERRLRASRIAGLAEVPCRVVNLTAKEASEIHLLENLQRVDLNALEEAQALSDLMFEHDYTQEQLAQKLGKSQPWVASRVRLLDLPEKVRGLITRGIVSASAGEVMGKYAAAAPEVVTKVAESMKDKPIPVSKVRLEIDYALAQKCKHLDCKQSWDKPMFDPAPCLATCPKALYLKPYDDERPYCSDTACWLQKDRDAREELKKAALAAAGEGAVDLEGVSGWTRLYPEDIKRCDEGCPARVRGVEKQYDGSTREFDACLKPGCRDARQKQANEDAAKVRAKTESDEILRCVNRCDSLGYASALGSLPERLRVTLACSVLWECASWYDEAARKRFANQIGWKGELSIYIAQTVEPVRFRETLAALPGPVLAQIVLDNFIARSVRASDPTRLPYLLDEQPPAPKHDPMEIPDDIDCPEDCDGDCDNCDGPGGQHEEEAGDDPVSPPVEETPAAEPEAATVDPEDLLTRVILAVQKGRMLPTPGDLTRDNTLRGDLQMDDWDIQDLIVEIIRSAAPTDDHHAHYYSTLRNAAPEWKTLGDVVDSLAGIPSITWVEEGGDPE